MKDLQEIRQDIDAIDKSIVELYEKRMEYVQEVANYKIRTGKKVLDKEREKQKIETLSSMASTEFGKEAVAELFDLIMSISRKKQYQLLSEHGKLQRLEFDKQKNYDFSDAKIVFQGVEGAYSQLAMNRFFGDNCKSFHVETWKDAMEAIKNQTADFAVLPIENSSAGIVSENYDLLMQYDNYIVAEQIIQINHSLLGLEGTDLTSVRTVYSHPQALMQCGEYLDENKEWEKISIKNTALAAKKVKEDGDKTQVAIASENTANIYGLKILQNCIQNQKNNATRFIIVSGKKIYFSDAKRISICFQIPHESGSLYRALSHFIFNQLNMTNIQSRPIPNRNWEYCFFLDFEGELEDTSVRNALRGLQEETTYFKILGTY